MLTFISLLPTIILILLPNTTLRSFSFTLFLKVLFYFDTVILTVIDNTNGANLRRKEHTDMKIELNVGRQAASIGLLVVMLTWLALAVMAMILGIEKFPTWPIGFVLAICLGWVTSMFYREIEIEAVKKQQRFLTERDASSEVIESIRPDPTPPPLSTFLSIYNRDDLEEEPDREGPPYGWVPMMGGAIIAGAAAACLYLPWHTVIIAIVLSLLAAGIEHPWLSRQMKKWPDFKDDSSTELVVPAILVAWATIEFTVGTPLGASALWATLAGWVAVTAISAVLLAYDKRDDAAANAVVGPTVIIGLLVMIALVITAGFGRLEWVWPGCYLVGIVAGWFPQPTLTFTVLRSKHIRGGTHDIDRSPSA